MTSSIYPVKPQKAIDQEYYHVDTLYEYFDQENNFTSPFNNASRSKAARVFDSRHRALKKTIRPAVVPTVMHADMLPAGQARITQDHIANFKGKYYDRMAYAEYAYLDLS